MVAQSDARSLHYKGRQSTSTRNPHAAAKPVPLSELAKLSNDDRIFRQWQAARGCPISDEAKSLFCVQALGQTYTLSDVRLWGNNKKADGLIYLEFFFDGSPEEFVGREDEFKKAFETMVENQLQEVRRSEFKKKLTARRRGVGRKQAEGNDEAAGEDGGSFYYDGNDPDWKNFLKTPVPETNLSMRSMREAGCMLRFLVCQTSISVSAAEVLGQITFQEHFPVDGVIQESKSTKPLPRWVYGLGCCTMTFTVLSVVAWTKVVSSAILSHSASPIPLSP